MIRFALAALVLAGCAASVPAPSQPGTLPPPSTIVVTTTTVARLAPLPVCEAPPYRLSVVPTGVDVAATDVELPADRYTAIEGTSTVVFVDGSDQPSVVLVRGSLPPDDWAGRTIRVDIDGVAGALGTMPDGAWAVAWAETGARCDQYSVIVYQPTTREEALAVAEGLRR